LTEPLPQTTNLPDELKSSDTSLANEIKPDVKASSDEVTTTTTVAVETANTSTTAPPASEKQEEVQSLESKPTDQEKPKNEEAIMQSTVESEKIEVGKEIPQEPTIPAGVEKPIDVPSASLEQLQPESQPQLSVESAPDASVMTKADDQSEKSKEDQKKENMPPRPRFLQELKSRMQEEKVKEPTLEEKKKKQFEKKCEHVFYCNIKKNFNNKN